LRRSHCCNQMDGKWVLLLIGRLNVTVKMSVDGGPVYINAGRNAAYTNLHIAALALGPDLNVFLGELRPREDWLHIFQVYLDELMPQPSYKDFTTPKKWKYRYLPDPLDLQSEPG
jgi:hypothetical protein